MKVQRLMWEKITWGVKMRDVNWNDWALATCKKNVQTFPSWSMQPAECHFNHFCSCSAEYFGNILYLQKTCSREGTEPVAVPARCKTLRSKLKPLGQCLNDFSDTQIFGIIKGSNSDCSVSILIFVICHDVVTVMAR